jgi:FkbM family methyltransferase
MSAPRLDRILALPAFRESAVHRTVDAVPIGFVDIGARGGTHPIMDPLAGVTAVLAFDPDPEEGRAIRAAQARAPRWVRVEVEAAAVATRSGEAVLHLAKAPVNHSLRPANPDFAARYDIPGLAPAGTVTVPAVTLDEAVFGARPAEPFWGEIVKSDAQGCDHDLLTGATRTLAERTVALVVECTFLEAYTGQKRFSETELLLRDAGFAFYGFLTLNSRSRRLVDKRKAQGRERLFYGDAVFLRDPLPSGGGRPLSERQQHVLFCAALLFGYLDFALDLALSTWAAGDPAEAARIRAVVAAAGAPEEDQVAELRALLAAVERAPEEALVRIGKFVDRRRTLASYDEVRLPE